MPRADRPTAIPGTLEFADGPWTAALGGAHRTVQPCRIWSPHLKQSCVSPTELVGPHPGNSGLHRSVDCCCDHGRTNRADLAKCKPWIIGSCVWVARLSSADRLAGAPVLAHSSRTGQLLAVRNSPVSADTRGFSSGRELGRTRRRIRWRNVCSNVPAKRSRRPLKWINPTGQSPPESEYQKRHWNSHL